MLRRHRRPSSSLWPGALPELPGEPSSSPLVRVERRSCPECRRRGRACCPSCRAHRRQSRASRRPSPSLSDVSRRPVLLGASGARVVRAAGVARLVGGARSGPPASCRSPPPPLLPPPPPEDSVGEASTGRRSARRFRIPFRGRRPSRRRRRSPCRRVSWCRPRGHPPLLHRRQRAAGSWRSRRAASAVSILVVARRGVRAPPPPASVVALRGSPAAENPSACRSSRPPTAARADRRCLSTSGARLHPRPTASPESALGRTAPATTRSSAVTCGRSSVTDRAVRGRRPEETRDLTRAPEKRRRDPIDGRGRELQRRHCQDRNDERGASREDGAGKRWSEPPRPGS